MQIVMKSCQETHCHFCFNEVPPDVLFCSSCTIPIYCSQECQQQAGGQQFVRNRRICAAQKHLPSNLQKHVIDTILASEGKCEATDVSSKQIPEHRHECRGSNWPAVLPTDILLAGRVMAKSIEKRKISGEISKPMETLELAHNYDQIPPASRLELHIYAVVLSYCLQHYYASDFPSVEDSTPQLVLLISQIKVNSMAVVHMRSSDGYGACEKSLKVSAFKNTLTCNVEQVRVGQAIYSTGSLFNHSCQPNIHAYFVSRKLILRSTNFVPAWCPLELSYGPQVGQSSLQERQKILKEHYSFDCHCQGCSELNLSDLVIKAFRCLKPRCLGAVSEMAYHGKHEDNFLQVSDPFCSYRLSFPVSLQKKDISKVARMLLPKPSGSYHIGPGYCLSCGLHHNLESLREASGSAMVNIERLKDSISTSNAPGILLSDALKSLAQLRSVRHPYSKIVAEAEDVIAEAFARVGEFGHAIQHCVASVKILEKLYNKKHIVVGHELMKLTSIQLSMEDRTTALCNIQRLEEIFLLYYGSHATIIFPYLDSLRKEADGLAS